MRSKHYLVLVLVIAAAGLLAVVLSSSGGKESTNREMEKAGLSSKEPDAIFFP